MTLNERRKARRKYYEERKQEIKEARKTGKKIHLTYVQQRPWISHYACAKKRCTNPSQINYKYYGGKGIKFELTVIDVQDLWIRDKANMLKQPSLDRKDPTKNYTFDNCRFIEHVENCSRANKGKKRK
jgi:hypothetical protein